MNVPLLPQGLGPAPPWFEVYWRMESVASLSEILHANRHIEPVRHPGRRYGAAAHSKFFTTERFD